MAINQATSTQFAWRPEFSVGIESIDAQHKQLIALVNTLHDAMAAGRGREVLGGIFEELLAYTVRHFADEERFMTGIRYPELVSHAALHRSLTEKATALRGRFQNGPVANSLEVYDFLQAWLTEHILRSDQAYASYHRGQR